jgi:hypothetical protein
MSELRAPPAEPDLALDHVLLDGQEHAAYSWALVLLGDGSVWAKTSNRSRREAAWRRIPEDRWHEIAVGGRPLRELVNEMQPGPVSGRRNFGGEVWPTPQQ